ncbi:MAG: hypothetical protein Q9227_006538 [Pyrenula ochraceoflavens]
MTSFTQAAFARLRTIASPGGSPSEVRFEGSTFGGFGGDAFPLPANARLGVGRAFESMAMMGAAFVSHLKVTIRTNIKKLVFLAFSYTVVLAGVPYYIRAADFRTRRMLSRPQRNWINSFKALAITVPRDIGNVWLLTAILWAKDLSPMISPLQHGTTCTLSALLSLSSGLALVVVNVVYVLNKAPWQAILDNLSVASFILWALKTTFFGSVPHHNSEHVSVNFWPSLEDIGVVSGLANGTGIVLMRGLVFLTLLGIPQQVLSLLISLSTNLRSRPLEDLKKKYQKLHKDVNSAISAQAERLISLQAGVKEAKRIPPNVVTQETIREDLAEAREFHTERVNQIAGESARKYCELFRAAIFMNVKDIAASCAKAVDDCRSRAMRSETPKENMAIFREQLDRQAKQSNDAELTVNACVRRVEDAEKALQDYRSDVSDFKKKLAKISLEDLKQLSNLAEHGSQDASSSENAALLSRKIDGIQGEIETLEKRRKDDRQELTEAIDTACDSQQHGLQQLEKELAKVEDQQLEASNKLSADIDLMKTKDLPEIRNGSAEHGKSTSQCLELVSKANNDIAGLESKVQILESRSAKAEDAQNLTAARGEEDKPTKSSEDIVARFEEALNARLAEERAEAANKVDLLRQEIRQEVEAEFVARDTTLSNRIQSDFADWEGRFHSEIANRDLNREAGLKSALQVQKDTLMREISTKDDQIRNLQVRLEATERRHAALANDVSDRSHGRAETSQLEGRLDELQSAVDEVKQDVFLQKGEVSLLNISEDKVARLWLQVTNLRNVVLGNQPGQSQDGLVARLDRLESNQTTWPALPENAEDDSGQPSYGYSNPFAFDQAEPTTSSVQPQTQEAAAVDDGSLVADLLRSHSSPSSSVSGDEASQDLAMSDDGQEDELGPLPNKPGRRDSLYSLFGTEVSLDFNACQDTSAVANPDNGTLADAIPAPQQGNETSGGYSAEELADLGFTRDALELLSGSTSDRPPAASGGAQAEPEPQVDSPFSTSRKGKEKASTATSYYPTYEYPPFEVINPAPAPTVSSAPRSSVALVSCPPYRPTPPQSSIPGTSSSNINPSAQTAGAGPSSRVELRLEESPTSPRHGQMVAGEEGEYSASGAEVESAASDPVPSEPVASGANVEPRRRPKYEVVDVDGVPRRRLKVKRPEAPKP